MRLDIHVHHHRDPDEAVLLALEQIMATLEDVLNEVTKEATAIGGITVLIEGLRKQIADAMAGQTIPPAIQAKVDAIFAAATANNAAIAQALADPGEKLPSSLRPPPTTPRLPKPWPTPANPPADPIYKPAGGKLPDAYGH